jgi:putative polyketide hydroxylase
MTKAGRTAGAVLGVTYQSHAILPDGTTPPAVANPVTDYAPGTTPGARAPHVWLHDGRSTLDLLGNGFTLLTSDPTCTQAANSAATRLKVPLTTHQLPESDWAALYGVDTDGAVLIRPDGHVAWRHARNNRHTRPHLDTIFDRLLT